MANGVGPPPNQPILQIITCGQLIRTALITGGIIGFDEALEPDILNMAFQTVNEIIAEWTTKRWLTYRLQDYAITSTGAMSYPVGFNQTVNINPRPDRLEYAFLRFLALPPQPPQFPVDIPLDIIQSHEDYSRITVKSIGTLAWRVFYDPKWPVGELFFWPVPQATIYEMHVGFKVVLPQFSSEAQAVNFPPEYQGALRYVLAREMRASLQLGPDPTIDSLARNKLNSIRLANSQMATLRLPAFLRSRHRAYDYRGDSDSF